MLVALNDGVLYSLVEEDLSTPISSDVSSSPAFQLTALAFKGGCALVEKGAVQAGETILGTAAGACVGQICEDEQGDGKKWSTIGDKLLEVLPQLSSRSIIDVAFRILAELKACGSVPVALHGFLPMLLDTLGAIGPVEIATEDAGGLIRRSGLALKSYWVESACSYRWDAKSSVSVCALLREIVLGERLIEVVANRMLRQLKVAEVNELPAMAYQLLLFARNGFKREIIGGILEFFDGLESSEVESQRWRELGDIEGTVMLHIMYSIKQDFELGDALIAHVKEQEVVASEVPTTFSFACLLALARIHRFEETVIGLLRTNIVKSINDAMALSATAWIQPLLPPIPLLAQQQLLSAVVERLSHGWDQVTQSLVQLCLSVMDLSGSAMRRGAYSALACAEARRISAEALKSAFGKHEFVRAEVIDQILSRVMFQSESHMHFLGLLGELVEEDSEAVRVFMPKFVDVFDSISVVTPVALEKMLAALLPIILDDAPFRASLILVLRKILFAHSFDDRRTALSGLFVLVGGLASALGECQSAGGARHLQRRADVLASALLEVLGLLRRCLTQQPEVRAASYERLGLLLDRPSVRSNSLLLSALHDIFRVEFAKYYRAPTQGCSPIDIPLCLHPVTSKVVMPVAGFLHCYEKLAVASHTLGLASGSSGGPMVAAREWGDLCVRFAKAQMEDFELDPTGDYSLDSQFGQRNFSTALLVVGCLDACIGYALGHIIQAATVGTGESDNPIVVVELFNKFARFGDMLSTRCIDERKKRIIPLVSDLSLLSLDSVAAALRLVLPDPARVDNEGHPLNIDSGWFSSRVARAALWSANAPLVKHLLEVALARVQRRAVAGSNSTALMPAPSKSALLEIAYIVYSGVLAYFGAEERPLPVYLKNRPARGRGVVLISAEILLACLNQLAAAGESVDCLAVAVFRPAPERFTGQEPEAACALECAAKLLAGLHSVVAALLRLKPVAVKDASTVLSSLHIVTARLAELAFGSAEKDQPLVYSCLRETALWTVGLVQSELPNDLGLMKSVVAQLTSSQAFLPTESSGDDVELEPVDQLTARMCKASKFHTRQPDEDDEDDEDDDVDEQELERFTLRSIPALASIILAWLKTELHRVDWAIAQLRRSVGVELGSGSDELDRSIGVERRICLRLSALSYVLGRMLAGSLPKAMYDQVIRSFVDLHRTWALLTRAKLACARLPITESYIDALSLICSELNTHAYTLITEKYSNMIGSVPPAAMDSKKKKEAAMPRPKSKVMRDSSLVSSLVYQMELSEKYVIQLSTKFKTPLAHYLKRSTVRDFRIKKSDIPELPASDNDNDALEDGDIVVSDQDASSSDDKDGRIKRARLE
ncbi:hypothetical protein IW152_004629 [Coemansia sp. BCRC 34962]|nr:hypothetical protein IW152_004629 [Coemansia sp. BCRC 34962]